MKYILFSLSLSVADQRAKRNGITCPTAEWLKSFLIPKLHKWMMEDGATFSLGQSLRLISVEKYSKKYEELKQKYKHFVKVNNDFLLKFGAAQAGT